MTEVEITLLWLVACGSAAFLGYLIVLRRLADIVQPYRLQLAELGEKILAEAPSDARRDQARFYLDNAFSGWVAPGVAMALPVVAVLAPFFSGRFRQDDVPTRDDRTLMLLFSLSVVAANPLFGMIMAVEALFVALFVVVISGPSGLAAALAALMRVERVLPGHRLRSRAMLSS
jgi:hypothetical protein